MRSVLASLLFTGCSLAAWAQTEVDLYRFSNTFNEGTARFEGMGGSFGALGAEIGSARINPAGFARYSSSQFTFGLSSLSLSNKTTFQGEDTKQNDYKMRLAAIGLVLTSDLSNSRGGFLYQQLGFGYNSVANFGNEFKYTGQQFESLLDGFCTQAEGVAPADLATYFPFSTSLAYETYAIDYDEPSQTYVPRLTAGDMLHTRTVTTRGGIGELHVSYSANYLNKLYLGANLGFQFLRYVENTLHHEELIDTVGVSLRSFDYMYNLKTSGSGTNLKVGVIYLPVEALRMGIAVHTPTFFELTDNWDANMTATHDVGTLEVPAELVPSANYKYRMRTPARIIGSLAYVFGTMGCINVDVEYLDYKWAHFKSTKDDAYAPYNYELENQAADERFKDVFNTRIGGELVLFTNYFLRAGVGIFPKGDKNILAFDSKPDMSYSGGVGARFNNWTIDAAVKTLTQTRNYVAFPGSSANINANTLYIVVNAQIKF